jgi:AGCS family alanine or glycine:cation symporter
MAHGTADARHPVEQGLMGIMEVFLDTIVICTMTALVILCSGTPIRYGMDEGLELTARAFSAVYGDWVCVLIAMETCCFAFATVLGWGLYGVRCAQYLFGDSAWKAFAWLQGATVILSALLKTGTVWLLAEIVNGLMAIPNLIALALLSPELIKLLKSYPGGLPAKGGTYAYFHQCQPLRAFSHEKVPSLCHQSPAAGQDHLSSEHRSAGPGNSPGIL